MVNLSFSPLHINHMTINMAYTLFKSSVDISIPFKSDLGDMVNAALTKLTTDNENFGKQINKNQKSGLTDSLAPLDKERDNLLSEIKRIVSSYLNSSDKDKKTAAKLLKLFLAPYWNVDELPLNVESGILTELNIKYNTSPDLMEAAQTLGIDPLFVKMEDKNLAFDVLYKSRNDEYSEREASGSSLKPMAIASYQLFSTAMEQAANLTPNESILSLFVKLDELRKKYHALGGSEKEKPGTTSL